MNKLIISVALAAGALAVTNYVRAANTTRSELEAWTAARAQAIVLAKKLKAGTATQAEKDALLLRLSYVLLSQDQ